jgi:hypothetical protein
MRLHCFLLLVVVAVVACAVALCASAAPGRLPSYLGGDPPGRRRRAALASPHLVVDALNLAHWRRRDRSDRSGPVGLCDVIETIDKCTPALQKKFTGRVVYVTKDRETAPVDAKARAALQAAARRNHVHIALAERYRDEDAAERIAAQVAGRPAHAAKGRDDFYLALLAWRLRCPVLTADRLRDFEEFRTELPPFHVREYAYWRDKPERDYVRPAAPAYAKVLKPVTLHPRQVLGATARLTCSPCEDCSHGGWPGGGPTARSVGA